ncbi:MAG: hypothetical protein ACI9MR_004297, partial [Myxococcota bacterium]
EAELPNEMEVGICPGAKPRDIARILGDQRVDEDDIHALGT